LEKGGKQRSSLLAGIRNKVSSPKISSLELSQASSHQPDLVTPVEIFQGDGDTNQLYFGTLQN
jgi:hypothetical protein